MKKNTKLSRRDFMKTTGAGLAAAGVASVFPGSVLGANERINVAVIGIRGQGGSHINGFGKLDNVRIKTVVDVDENLFRRRVSEIDEKFGYDARTEYDMRRVFDDPDIHAVTFATPNHWHALGTIWAAQAGKHVYVEKPSCHNIWEGRQMVHAARANDVLVQVGFQNRSRLNTMAAIQFLREGGIGNVYMARGLCYKPRGDIGRYPDGPMNPGEKFAFTVDSDNYIGPYTEDYLDDVHYDLWVGPAPMRPFNRNRFHYNWHWQWEYGNGDTGNQGPHQLDVGRWGLGHDDYPVKVHSTGGYYVYDSAQETPNTQTIVFEYADGTIFEFETRGLPTNAAGELKIGDIFYGSEGRLEIDAGGDWKTFFGHDDEPGPNSEHIDAEESDALVTVGSGAGGHYGNFIAALRSGKKTDLNCDIEVGHRSSCLAHLANISYRLGRELMFDGEKEVFVGDTEANDMLRRETYRAPYVVPDLS